MGNEMCVSEKQESSEIKFMKPETNLLLNKGTKKNNNFSILPQINLEIEKQNDKKDESEELDSNNNIIRNDELVYSRIDNITLKKKEEIEIKNTFEKNNNNVENINFNNEKIIEDEDGPKDNVKNINDLQNIENNNLSENIVSTNNDGVKPLDINSNNNNNNYINNINENNKNEIIDKANLTYTPVSIKQNKLENKANSDSNKNSLNQEILQKNNLQEKNEKINQDESSRNNENTHKNTEEFYKNKNIIVK